MRLYKYQLTIIKLFWKAAGKGGWFADCALAVVTESANKAIVINFILV
ncbi:hypothetical protein [Mucilaginibacter antarcticus]